MEPFVVELITDFYSIVIFSQEYFFLLIWTIDISKHCLNCYQPFRNVPHVIPRLIISESATKTASSEKIALISSRILPIVSAVSDFKIMRLFPIIDVLHSICRPLCAYFLTNFIANFLCQHLTDFYSWPPFCLFTDNLHTM